MCKLFPNFASEFMGQKEKEILMQAAELFTKYGIKSMTMDDVARHLGISKKTLYQYVDNKKDLVKKSIQLHIDEEQCCMKEVLQSEGNAIDELMMMTKMVGSQMKEMHPSVIFDLKKYHLDAYKGLLLHRDDFIYSSVKRNIENGMESNLYRSNINSEILTRLYLSMVNVILDPEITSLSQHSAADIHTEMIRYHIRGIASSKGREYLKQKFSKDNV
ncbi:MAG: TetR/AcrR family transcriptional regulator [Flavobacteriales bacterium]|nr:TetR/AcrR family transcriptional regulator [Flavobacteriales bacterium]